MPIHWPPPWLLPFLPVHIPPIDTLPYNSNITHAWHAGWFPKQLEQAPIMISGADFCVVLGIWTHSFWDP